MRKSGLLLVLFLVLGLVAGSASANGFHEAQKEEYWVSWDGGANVTLDTILYGPTDLLNRTKESILGIGIKNATRLFASQTAQKLAQQGLKLENATAEIIGYNSTGPLETIVRGYIPNFAKYYSYDGVWEISLDVLRVADLYQIDPTKMNGSVMLENTFVVHLPKGAKVTALPENYSATSNGSYVKIGVSRNGSDVVIHSTIYFAKGISYADIQKIYGKPRAFVVQYRGKPGKENATTWKMQIFNNITVGKNQTVFNSVEKYLEPESYIKYLKVQIAYQGVDKAEQGLYQRYAQAFQKEGVTVRSGKVGILNLNSTGPLVVEYHFILQNFTREVNGTYVYAYDPKLELGTMKFLNRLDANINETKTTMFALPKGAKFVEIPKNIEINANGNRIVLKVERVRDSEVIIKSEVFLRYGTPLKDYQELMSKVPNKVEFKYQLGSGSNGKGICGPALLVALAVLPLLLLKRRP
ncbi:CGP-CTERM sorting domain-containing protein [Thermococcus sp.]|uniref:CGP-CTERM sorting domain-containing protein n=1 Tax=Thermococcus sp. TaxID=35749 RepID=UPI00261295B5|nr:CGP-CTERM sorting domain-containing protein [Thermococcus sp.]